MQKHEEDLVTVTAKIGKSQNQKLLDLMTGRSKNKSQIIRDAIDHEWERHVKEVNSQLPIDTEAI